MRRLAAALAIGLGLLVPGAFLTPAEADVENSMALGVDLPGNDIQVFPMSNGDPAQCRQACDRAPACAAWSFAKPGVLGPQAQCYLKSAQGAAVTNPNAISGLRTVPFPGGGGGYGGGRGQGGGYGGGGQGGYAGGQGGGYGGGQGGYANGQGGGQGYGGDAAGQGGGGYGQGGDAGGGRRRGGSGQGGGNSGGQGGGYGGGQGGGYGQGAAGGGAPGGSGYSGGQGGGYGQGGGATGGRGQGGSGGGQGGGYGQGAGAGGGRGQGGSGYGGAQTAGAPTAGGMRILSGTYGSNCGAQEGNVTAHLAQSCNGRAECAYRVDYTVIGDPASGCQKNYVAKYSCGGNDVRQAAANPEAGFGSVVTLSCAGAAPTGYVGGPPNVGGAIRVLSGTYGANCGAPAGNVTPHLAQTCNGRGNCGYRVDYTVIGDPVPGCQKNYVAQYSCGGDVVRQATASPEAGFGSVVTLTCGG